MRRAAVLGWLATLVVAAPASARSVADLAVSGAPRTPARALTAHVISVAVVVRNRGPGEARGTRVRVRFGLPGTPPEPAVVGSARVARLARGHRVRVRVRVRIPDRAQRVRSVL